MAYKNAVTRKTMEHESNKPIPAGGPLYDHAMMTQAWMKKKKSKLEYATDFGQRGQRLRGGHRHAGQLFKKF